MGLFALDTGSNAGLTLDRGFVDKNGFDSGHASLRVKSAAVDGLAEMAELGRLPDGAVVGLRVLRDGSVLSLALALKELLP